jgi:hypothetical protein
MEEAVAESKEMAKDAQELAEEEGEGEWNAIKPENIFIRPAIFESPLPVNMDCAAWVVIELDPMSADEKTALAMFHVYDDLGNVPGEVIMHLKKRSPRFLLAMYESNIGFTSQAFDYAGPILRSLQTYISMTGKK